MSTQSIDEIKGKVKDLLRERTALTTAIGETLYTAMSKTTNFEKFQDPEKELLEVQRLRSRLLEVRDEIVSLAVPLLKECVRLHPWRLTRTDGIPRFPVLCKKQDIRVMGAVLCMIDGHFSTPWWAANTEDADFPVPEGYELLESFTVTQQWLQDLDPSLNVSDLICGR